MAVILNIVLLCLGLYVGTTAGGECCKAYYDLTFEYHPEKWCSDYCCGSSLLGILDCCSETLLIAPSDERKVVCLDFFLQNIWVPILIGVGGLFGFIVIVGLCMACCGGSKTRGQVNPQQPATNVIMMAPGGPYQQQQQQPGPYPPPNGPQGYGMNTNPAFPPQYQPPPGPNTAAQGQSAAGIETQHPFGANEQSKD